MSRLSRQLQNGTYPVDVNQGQNIKIPMNMPIGQVSMQVNQMQGNQGQFILNPNSNGTHTNTANSPQGNNIPISIFSPMGGFGETAPI